MFHSFSMKGLKYKDVDVSDDDNGADDADGDNDIGDAGLDGMIL